MSWTPSEVPITMAMYHEAKAMLSKTPRANEPPRIAELRAEIMRHGGPQYAIELLAEIDRLRAGSP